MILFYFFTFPIYLFCAFLFFFSLCSLWYIRKHYTHTKTKQTKHILLFTLPLALVLRSDAVAAAVAVFRVPPVAAAHVIFNFIFILPST